MATELRCNCRVTILALSVFLTFYGEKISIYPERVFYNVEYLRKVIYISLSLYLSDFIGKNSTIKLLNTHYNVSTFQCK
jgi:hypothetical protein